MPDRIATYRMQFREAFNLDAAVDTLPFLNDLGISHIYASPLLQAVPGSAHGYDGIDPTRINEALGGMPALERLSGALRAREMGLVMDMVPNHMAVHPGNPWWWDVLKNGPSSRYASYFDVEWDSPEPRFADVVLLPVLGDHYGRVLEAGEIQLAFDGAVFTIHYFDNRYPVDPGSLGGVLRAAAERSGIEAARDMLAFIAGVYERLPAAARTDLSSARRRYRDAAVLQEMLGRFVREQPAAGRAIHEVVGEVNENPDALDALLRRQNYRLALWKVSARELGYRRFFDINTLIGLRVEDEDVFRDTHALPLELLERGVIDGLRIDHPDGLLDPGGYFARLRAAADAARQDTWVVIEKILEPGEHMPSSWPVHGTTGYDFLNRANGLLIDPQAEAPLTDFYRRFTGEDGDYRALVRLKKLEAAQDVLGSDLSRLAGLLLQVCERHRRYRDYNRGDLYHALAETAANMPVYRTYARPGEAGLEDREHIAAAIRAASEARPDLDPLLLDFLGAVLRFEVPGEIEEELAVRFQQFTGPVMAKGVEDSLFYFYTRFISLNEVGGDPGIFGVSPGDFHRACAETLARWPLSMLATSTHDTKRSEDVRARLNVLSEVPYAWMDAVESWAEMNDHLRVATQEMAGPRGAEPGAVDAAGRWPDRSMEYLFYQSLVGAWPVSAERMVEYMTKAGREAKRFTTWTAPNARYEKALEQFVRGALENPSFTASVEAFVRGILTPGRINGLAQTLLKLTTPGIPDFYQGSELWHMALVDPDNRRPVDYPRSAALLAGLRDDTPPEQVLEGMDDGLPKLWVIRQALALRRAHPEWFGPRGRYTPLELVRAATAQDLPEPALAFLRGEGVLVAVPRLTMCLGGTWQQVALPLPQGRWRSLLTHETFEGGARMLAELFRRFPVQLLVSAEGPSPNYLP